MSNKFDSELSIYLVSGKGIKAVVKAKTEESAERLVRTRTKKSGPRQPLNSYAIGIGCPNFMSDECCSPPHESEEIVLIKRS
jgi:hypothetical protein